MRTTYNTDSRASPKLTRFRFDWMVVMPEVTFFKKLEAKFRISVFILVLLFGGFISHLVLLRNRRPMIESI